jgi:hypothetical protein
MRANVLLSLQRVLLGHIGMAARRVSFRWTRDSIHVRVVFDGEISEVDTDAMSVAETEVIADSPQFTVVIFRLERCDSPARIKDDTDEVAVFMRLAK